MNQQGQLLTLETEKEVESCNEVPVTKISIESIVTPGAQDLSAAVKVAAFKIRTQRYFQVIFRIFSM
jgi:hypothetical protein